MQARMTMTSSRSSQGMRRCEKSTLIEMFMNELIESGIDRNDVFHLELESGCGDNRSHRLVAWEGMTLHQWTHSNFTVILQFIWNNMDQDHGPNTVGDITYTPSSLRYVASVIPQITHMKVGGLPFS